MIGRPAQSRRPVLGAGDFMACFIVERPANPERQVTIALALRQSIPLSGGANTDAPNHGSQISIVPSRGVGRKKVKSATVARPPPPMRSAMVPETSRSAS